MTLVLFLGSGERDLSPGLFPKSQNPQSALTRIIDRFAELETEFERPPGEGEAIPLSDMRFCAPLPRPGKILCCIGNTREHKERSARPRDMCRKNPDAAGRRRPQSL